MKIISPCLLFLGALTFGASVFIGYFLLPYKVWENIMENSKITPGNLRFQSWQRVPIPIFQPMYFFNVTNPDEVVQGRKPILQEIGPYVYQLKREKFDILFNEDNGTIFYREKTDFIFRPDLSNGSESDWVTFVNLPYVGAATAAMKQDPLTRYIILESLRKFPEQLYLHLTIKQLTFGGYYLPFMKELSEFNGEELIPNNTFGLYYKRNGTNQGRFEVYSGVKHPEKFGSLASWNGKTSLDWWGSEYCNQINGSDGAMFTPYSNNDMKFFMFIPGLCKSFRFDFEEDGIEVKGVPVSKFSLQRSFFQSAKTNPDNACYCEDATENLDKCPEDGVFSMSGCGKGAMMLSQPHFYQGSDLYLNQSIGLQPNKDKHEMALYIEPYTSAPAKVKIRFQMNANLQPVKFLRPLKRIPKMVHPLFWIDQNVEIPEENAITLRDKLYRTLHIAAIATHVGIIIGLALIILSIITFFMCTLRHPLKEGAEEEKVECVSYHPSETMPKIFNGSLAYKSCNGNFSNGFINNSSSNYPHHRIGKNQPLSVEEEEVNPFLQQLPKSSLEQLNVAADKDQQEQIVVTYCPDDDDDSGITNNSSSTTISFKPFSDSQTNDDQYLQDDPAKTPDSLLSPFPVVTDYSSSLSIVAHNANNTRKDLIDATSSYENL